MRYILIILLFSSCTVNKYYCLDCKQKNAEQVHIPPKISRWWPSYPLEHLDWKGTSIDSVCCYVPFNGLLIPEQQITYFASDSVNAEIISVDSLMKRKKVTSDSVRKIKTIKLQ